MPITFQQFIVSSVALMATLYGKRYIEIDREITFPINYPFNYNLQQQQIKQYDFIIVGAGSSGCIIANRLSKKFSVLLLEAGGEPTPQTYVPAFYRFLRGDPLFMYFWNSTQQIYSNLDNDGISGHLQGKFLGGSSVVYGMTYNRGSPYDYDNWANLLQDNSWKYSNVLKYFKMNEDFYEDENLNGQLGVGGLFPIQRGFEVSKLTYDAFLNAGIELGYKWYNNSNNPQREGFTPISKGIKDGRRVISYDAFIKPILKRRNLDVSRYSVVTKIDINEENRAVGVFFTKHGVRTYARANLEVIISGGAMNSPGILLRSGIGPELQLREAGIPVRANLLVGQHFQDHPYTIICANYPDNTYPLYNFSFKDVEEYIETGKGQLSSVGSIGQAFIVSSNAKGEGTPYWPDIQLHLYYNADLYYQNSENNICFTAFVQRVKSKGSICLDPNNPNDQLIWDPRWLSKDRDHTVLAEGIKIAANIFETKSFKSIGIKLNKTLHPSCTSEIFGTNSYWECYVRRTRMSTFHPSGTCKMGKKEDIESVVDTLFQVKGINGLRVIDNSILPEITNSNLHAVAMMIAQKGSHDILQKYKHIGSTIYTNTE